MKEIIFVNVNFNGNVGDFWSSPLKYYDFSKFNIRHVHFMDVWESIKGTPKFEHAKIEDKMVIIGGGGLLTTEGNFMQETTEYLVRNNKVVFWGVGSNTFETPTYDILHHPNVLLSGIRDIVYGLNIDYLPCVSCKHSLFDISHNIVDEIGIIEHPRLPIQIDKIPKITNQSSIKDIINFIGSKQIVLSSTFHGVYWSQLLNKKVLYIQTTDKVNSKFINMKHRVSICNSTNYLETMNQISSTNGMLQECRKLNDDFYIKILEILKDTK